MADLNTFVHVTDEDGVSHVFGPSDSVPGWAVEKITNPDVWVEEPDRDGEPDESWTVKQLKAFAESEGIDLGDAKSKADILSKLVK